MWGLLDNHCGRRREEVEDLTLTNAAAQKWHLSLPFTAHRQEQAPTQLSLPKRKEELGTGES